MGVKKTPITNEDRVAAIKALARKIAIQMDPALCGSFAGDALIGQLLGLQEFEHCRIDLSLVQAERVFKLFLDACAFVPDIRRLEKGVIPDSKAIMRRVRSEINEREAIRAASKKDAIAQMASASGLL